MPYLQKLSLYVVMNDGRYEKIIMEFDDYDVDSPFLSNLLS